VALRRNHPVMPHLKQLLCALRMHAFLLSRHYNIKRRVFIFHL
jgi:hypothetical protein